MTPIHLLKTSNKIHSTGFMSRVSILMNGVSTLLNRKSEGYTDQLRNLDGWQESVTNEGESHGGCS